MRTPRNPVCIHVSFALSDARGNLPPCLQVGLFCLAPCSPCTACAARPRARTQTRNYTHSAVRLHGCTTWVTINVDKPRQTHTVTYNADITHRNCHAHTCMPMLRSWVSIRTRHTPDTSATCAPSTRPCWTRACKPSINIAIGVGVGFDFTPDSMCARALSVSRNGGYNEHPHDLCTCMQ